MFEIIGRNKRNEFVVIVEKTRNRDSKYQTSVKESRIEEFNEKVQHSHVFLSILEASVRCTTNRANEKQSLIGARISKPFRARHVLLSVCTSMNVLYEGLPV